MIDIVFTCLIFSLLFIGLIIFIKNLKEIFVSFLQYLAYNSDYTFRVISMPVWIPFWIIDKIFKLNIFKVEFPDKRNDIHYKSEKNLFFKIELCNKYIMSNSKVEILKSKIKDFFETIKYPPPKIYVGYVNDIVVLKIECNDFNLILGLIQWLGENSLINKPQAVFINPEEMKSSFFLVQDISSEHINSFVGKNFNKEIFTVNVLDDFSKEQYLELNNEVKIDREFDFLSFKSSLSKIDFEQLRIS